MTENDILSELEKLNTLGYDVDSPLWEYVKSNTHLLPNLINNFKQIILYSEDSMLIDVAVWCIFWNGLNKDDVLKERAMALVDLYSYDFDLVSRILTGLGINYSNSTDKELVSFLMAFSQDSDNDIAHRVFARFSLIQIQTGLNSVKIAKITDVSFLEISNEKTLDALINFKSTQ